MESCRNVSISLPPIFFNSVFLRAFPLFSPPHSNQPSWDEEIVSELSSVAWHRRLIVNK